MSVRGSLLRSASRIPDREDCVVGGMRQLLMRVGSDGSGTHALDRRGGGVRSPGPSGRAEDRASGAFSFGRGLDFPPFLIRSEASLYEAQAEGLHARIRRSSGNSRPLCLIREARRPGTEGAGPILAAACCSHSPVRICVALETIAYSKTRKLHADADKVGHVFIKIVAKAAASSTNQVLPPWMVEA